LLKMRDQELIDLYEAYASIYETSANVGPVEMEKDPYTNPKTGKPHTYASRQKALKDKTRKEEVEEVEVVDEAMSSYERNRQRAAQRAAARNEARRRGQTGIVPGVGYVTPRPERETWTDESGRERHKTGARMPKKEDQKESFDLFDTILEYLVAEGYADTNEAAIVIMANMSEEWRQSIVEEVISEEERPFPDEKVERKQKSLRGQGGNALERRMKMGLARRRAKEAEKTGGSQQDAGKGWYHGK
jgi:hypothetical protein